MTTVAIRCLTVAAVAAGICLSGVGAQAAPAPRYDAMLQRPLFSPSRRPPPAPIAAEPMASPAPPAPPPMLPPDVALSGIIAGGGGGLALLRRPQDPVPIRVALGGTIDGWTVAEIHPRSIVLRRDARSVTVDLPVAPR